MKRVLIVIAACGAAFIVLSIGGLFYMKSELTSFPSFDITAEKTSLSNDEIFGWIEEIVSFGPRKPATEADEKTRAFITAKFTEFGLTVEKPEPVPVETQRVNGWSLSLKDRKTGEEIEVPSYHIPFPAPTPEGGIEAGLIHVGEEHGGQVYTFDKGNKRQPAKYCSVKG